MVFKVFRIQIKAARVFTTGINRSVTTQKNIIIMEVKLRGKRMSYVMKKSYIFYIKFIILEL